MSEKPIPHVPIPTAQKEAAERFKRLATHVPLTEVENMPDPEYGLTDPAPSLSTLKAKAERGAEIDGQTHRSTQAIRNCSFLSGTSGGGVS